MRDKIDHVEARDAFLLQKIERVRLGLLEHRDQHGRPVYLRPSRRLRMQRRALKRPLNAGRVARRDLDPAADALDALVEVALQFAAQRIDIRAALFEHVAGGEIMEHRVQHVLQADVFVAPTLRLGHR